MDNCMVDKSYAYLDNKKLEMSKEWGTLFLVGQDILDELLLVYLSINEVEFIWISPCFSQVS